MLLRSKVDSKFVSSTTCETQCILSDTPLYSWFGRLELTIVSGGQNWFPGQIISHFPLTPLAILDRDRSMPD